MRTGLRDAEDAARGDDLAATVAGRAGPGARTGFRARTVADVAALGFGDGDFLLAAHRGFLERDLQVVAKVVAALGLGRDRCARPPKNSSKMPPPPPKTSRKISNGSWKPPPKPPAPAPPAPGDRTRRGRIGRTRRAFADRSGLRRPRPSSLKLSSAALSPGILVRMIFDGQLAVGLLDLVFVGIASPRRGLRSSRVWP